LQIIIHNETIVKGPKYDNIDEVEYKEHYFGTEDAGTTSRESRKGKICTE